jgi:hypothetical protein
LALQAKTFETQRDTATTKNKSAPRRHGVTEKNKKLNCNFAGNCVVSEIPNKGHSWIATTEESEDTEKICAGEQEIDD